MANSRRQYMTNAKDLKRFNKKKEVVVNTRHTPHPFARSTRSVGMRPGYNTMNQIPGNGNDGVVLQPCPSGQRPCGYTWSGDEPGMGSRSRRCCDMMDMGRGRDR